MKTTKTLISTLLIAFSFIIFGTSQAFASEKGEKSLGVLGGFASYNTSGYAGVSFQYTIIPHIRLAPEVSYVFRNNDKSGMNVSLDLQFPFRVAKAFNIYPIAGAAFSSWNDIGHKNANKFGGNVGAGMELYMTSNLKLSLQAKYNIVGRTNCAYAGIGFHYIF